MCPYKRWPRHFFAYTGDCVTRVNNRVRKRSVSGLLREKEREREREREKEIDGPKRRIEPSNNEHSIR